MEPVFATVHYCPLEKQKDASFNPNVVTGSNVCTSHSNLSGFWSFSLPHVEHDLKMILQKMIQTTYKVILQQL